MVLKENTAGPEAALKHDLTLFSKLGHIYQVFSIG